MLAKLNAFALIGKGVIFFNFKKNRMFVIN